MGVEVGDESNITLEEISLSKSERVVVYVQIKDSGGGGVVVVAVRGMHVVNICHLNVHRTWSEVVRLQR